jgi:hypothetical protein
MHRTFVLLARLAGVATHQKPTFRDSNHLRLDAFGVQ